MFTDLITFITEKADYVGMIMPTLLAGTKVMFQLFCWTLILSLPLGLPLALGSNTRFWPVKIFCRFYIFLFRGTPLILQLYFFYFVLPIAFDIRMSAMMTAIITFALNYAAYFAEIYRGGINGIDEGQYEAAKALGLSKADTMFGIVLPQTIRIILPPVSNEAITLVKDTALASVIALGELMKASRGAVNRDVDMTAYIVAAVIYLMFTFLLTVITNRLERRYSLYNQREVS